MNKRIKIHLTFVLRAKINRNTKILESHRMIEPNGLNNFTTIV